MKNLLTFLFSFIFIASQGQENDTTIVDWNKLKFTHAKAYLYAIEKGGGHIIVNGKLNPTVVNHAGAQLNKEQMKQAVQVAMGNLGEYDNPAFCFFPHHGIVFYNEEKAVSFISICFECNHKAVIPQTSLDENGSPDKGIEILKQIIVKLGLPVFKDRNEYYQYSDSLKSKKN